MIQQLNLQYLLITSSYSFIPSIFSPIFSKGYLFMYSFPHLISTSLSLHSHLVIKYPSFSVISSPSHLVSLSSHHLISQSSRHPQSFCHQVTQSPSHLVSLSPHLPVSLSPSHNHTATSALIEG